MHILGVINCAVEQMGPIQARLGLRDGELLDSTRADESEPGTDIANIGYLAL